MAKEISGVRHEYNNDHDLRYREGHNSQSSNHTLYVIRKRESIRLPTENPKNHVDVLLTKRPCEQVQVGVQTEHLYLDSQV
jgi:hypothetical protein